MSPWVKPTIAAVSAVVVLVVVLVVVHAVQAARERERACEFQRILQGYEPAEASALCHGGGG